MSIYSSNLGEAHMLEGILTMIASVPYEAISPKGQIMAMGLLTNKILSVRDKAIQCFERWNSKKGLDYLKNISCSPRWLQNWKCSACNCCYFLRYHKNGFYNYKYRPTR